MVYPHPLSGIPPLRLATAADVEGHHIVGPSLPPVAWHSHSPMCPVCAVCACATSFQNGQFYLVDLSRVFPPEAPNARCAPSPSPADLALDPSFGPKICNPIAAQPLPWSLHRPIAAAREWATSIASSDQVLPLPPRRHQRARQTDAGLSISRAGEAFPDPALQRRIQVNVFFTVTLLVPCTWLTVLPVQWLRVCLQAGPRRTQPRGATRHDTPRHTT